jgi:hypothetical protein
MPDAWSSEPNSQGVSLTRPLRGQVLLVAAAAFLIIGGVALWRMGSPHSPAPRPVTTAVTAPVKNPVLDELVKTTRALNDSQQQAIDQLQVLQDTVASQAAALKASSDATAALNDRLETLRRSFASAAQPVAEPVAKSVQSPPHKRQKLRHHTSLKPKRPGPRVRR